MNGDLNHTHQVAIKEIRHRKISHQKLYSMFKNYLKIAFRNLWRHRVFSFINIMGLTVGFDLFFPDIPVCKV